MKRTNITELAIGRFTDIVRKSLRDFKAGKVEEAAVSKAIKNAKKECEEGLKWLKNCKVIENGPLYSNALKTLADLATTREADLAKAKEAKAKPKASKKAPAKKAEPKAEPKAQDIGPEILAKAIAMALRQMKG